MKHRGNVSYFVYARNRELMAAFRRVLHEKTYFDVNSDFELVVNTPCSRFWVSEERAKNVIADMIVGKDVLSNMHPSKQEMYLEIYRRVIEKQKTSNNTLYNIIFDVVNSEAPKFYMHPIYARNIIYKMKHGHFKYHSRIQ